MPSPPLPKTLHHLHLLRKLRGGHIMLGCVEPFTNVAIACTATEMLASLKWKEDEGLDQLLIRLDAAVGEAMASGKPVNELDAVFTRPLH